MNIGLIGRKCGMTRVFTPEGISIPVSVLEILPNRVTQIKKAETDGYYAIQVTTGTRRSSRVSKPMAGHFAKANTAPGRGLWEFRVDASFVTDLTVGAEFTASIFKEGQLVDVSGHTRGRGFTGTIVRWNFASQRASHGNSVSHNTPGSIGQNQTPGRVFKGKKMSGQWGDEKRTIQSLEIIRVDAERNMILVKGAIPGAPGGDIIVLPAIKKRGTSDAA